MLNNQIVTSPNFTCLLYPKVKNIPEEAISNLTKTKTITEKPSVFPVKNPILYRQVKKGIILIWSYKTKISKTELKISKSTIKVLYTVFNKLPSIIVSLNQSEDQKIICETPSGIYFLNDSLEILYSITLPLKDLHLNPYYPTQIAYLSEDKIIFSNKKSSSFICEEILGFDFDFSPFVLNLYNANSIYLKDIRESTQNKVFSSCNIQQVLPIDSSFSYCVLNDEIELVDCRYWRPYKKFSKLSKEKSYLFSLPKRHEMYQEKILAEKEVSLYSMSSIIERINHSKYDSITETLISFIPEFNDIGKIEPTIRFPGLYSCVFCEFKSSKFWVQTCDSGGLYIENLGDYISLCEIAYKSKILHRGKMKNIKKVNKTAFLRKLINEKTETPFSRKPELPFTIQPILEDFDD